MPTIKVDEDVFARLQSMATPFVDEPNDVLRRLLVEGDVARPSTTTTSGEPRRRPGVLAPYLEQGLLRPGEVLVYRMPRLGRVARASITPDGWIRVDGEDFQKPSPSLRQITGTQVNGWLWIYEPTGKTLNKQCGRK